ncbi:MAG: conjugal transfer protein TraF [Planctomycetes bacterium]|nr:conjugal transfer protein TraF [Planctomycetota bacterium]
MRARWTSLLLVAFCTPAAAQEWWPVDAQSRSMGNSGVALNDQVGATYVNAANLASGLDTPFSLTGGLGGGVFLFADIGVEEDTMAMIDAVTDLYTDFAADQAALNTAAGADNLSIQDAIRVVDFLAHLNEDGHGVFASVAGGMEMRFGSFGVFARQIGIAGADPFSDLSLFNASAFSNLLTTDFYQQLSGGPPTTPEGLQLSAALAAAGIAGDADGDTVPDNDELAFQAEQALGGAAVADPALQQALIQVAQNTQANAGGSEFSTLFYNGSGVEMRSVLMREVGISAGFAVPILPILSSARVGISLKEVMAQTFVTRITLKDLEDGMDVYERLPREFDENREQTNKFNIDLGAAVSPLPWVTVGLSARNLIPMEFDFASPSLVDKFQIDPQVKVGLGFTPLGMLRLGIDADLNEIDLDMIQGLRSQVLAGGFEVDLLPVRLRGGVFANLGAPDPQPVYTFGVGLNLMVLTVDVFGQMAATKEQIEQASTLNASDSVFVPSRLSAGATVGLNLGF